MAQIEPYPTIEDAILHRPAKTWCLEIKNEPDLLTLKELSFRPKGRKQSLSVTIRYRCGSRFEGATRLEFPEEIYGKLWRLWPARPYRKDREAARWHR